MNGEKVVNKVKENALLIISFQTFAILCVAFSWLGMKTIAGFSWIVLFIASVSTLTKINNNMGMLGFAYILFAFLSIGMQIAGGYINISADNLKNEFFTKSNVIKSDVNHSIDSAKQGVKTAIGAATTLATGVPINGLNNNEQKNI